MKNYHGDFKLSINEPCHENWDRMLPDEKGKFCLSCQKVVHDFTKKTKEEIIEFFRLRKFQTVCARVNDELLFNSRDAERNLFRKKATFHLAYFAYALFIVFGSALFSCTAPTQQADEREHDLTGIVVMADQLVSPNHDELSLKTIPPIIKVQEEKKIYGEQLQSLFNDTVFLPEITVKGNNEQFARCGTAGAVTVSYYITYDDTIRTPAFPHSPLGKEEKESLAVPDEPSLEIFPNPSSGEFQVHYKLVAPVFIEMDVFNISGQFVDRIIASQQKTEGEHLESFNLQGIAAGIYFLRLQMGEQAITSDYQQTGDCQMRLLKEE